MRRTSIFTTHTPVPAGHDAFDVGQVAECAGMSLSGGLRRRRRARRRRSASIPRHESREFQMTVLAIRLAGHVNGVAQAARRRVAPAVGRPLERSSCRAGADRCRHQRRAPRHLDGQPDHAAARLPLGDDWGFRLDDAEIWDAVLGLDAREVWTTHDELKRMLLRYLREEARRRWRDEWSEAAQVVAAGHAARPAGLHDRLRAPLRHLQARRPALPRHRAAARHRHRAPGGRCRSIFAGKAHPQDTPGKEILQSLYHFTRDPRFEGRVAFLEDYDMHLAHLLVQGVDLWLNLPRVPLEASGTSGMKAALNGVPQLSTLDGWWEEGFNGKNGWAIPKAGRRRRGRRRGRRRAALSVAGEGGRPALVRQGRRRAFPGAGCSG